MRRCGSFGERFATSVAASSSAALSRCQSERSASLGGSGRGIEGQTAADAVRGALEPQQHVLTGDRRRFAGDGCRDERVAVAVAADPRAHPHERADDRCPPARGRALQRVVDAAVHVGDRGVERLVEDRHHGTHLVGGRGLLGAQRSRAPQRVDLLEHPPLGATLVRAVAQRRVVLLEERGKATDAGRDRAPPGLGGVSGEDGMEAQTLQALERGVVADLRGEAHERGGDRVGGILAIGTTVALAQDPDALVLLGEVHEVEVAGERAGDLVGPFDRERVGDLGRVGERLRRLVGVRVDRRDAEPLDVLVQPR